MSETLNDLFAQIIYSERKAQERKNYLQEVKAKLTAAEEELSDSHKEYERLKGQLVLKVQHWKEEELKLTYLTSSEEILTEQRRNLSEEKEDINQQLEKLKADENLFMKELCSEIGAFSHDYDLIGQGSVARESAALREVEELESPVKALTEELGLYEMRLERIGEIDEVVHQLQLQLEEKQLHITALDQEVEDSEDRVATLERKKSEVSSIPLTGKEFKMLHQELESLQCDELEKRCQVLQGELRQLQQQLRHKAVHQQQQHRIWLEQQRRQTPHDSKSMETSKVEMTSTSNRVFISSFPNREHQETSQNGLETSVEGLVEEDFDDDLPDLSLSPLPMMTRSTHMRLTPSPTQQATTPHRKAIFLHKQK